MMAHEDWKVAAAFLRARGANVGRDQIELAEKLDVRLPQRIPALVAAQLIRDHLAGPLREGSASEPTYGQAEFLHDLCEALGVKYPSRAETRALASAWIEALAARRALKALKEREPGPGDIVHPANRPDDLGVVVSISNDGRINVAGPGGRGIPAHRARVVARAGNTDEWTEDFVVAQQTGEHCVSGKGKVHRRRQKPLCLHRSESTRIQDLLRSSFCVKRSNRPKTRGRSRLASRHILSSSPGLLDLQATGPSFDLRLRLAASSFRISCWPSPIQPASIGH